MRIKEPISESRGYDLTNFTVLTGFTESSVYLQTIPTIIIFFYKFNRPYTIP